MRRLLLLPLAAVMAAGAIFASDNPDRSFNDTKLLAGFPADSIDLSVMTFTIDGDTVSREEFFRLHRSEIRTLAVIPAPANLVEVETYAAAMTPLQPDSLPADIDYEVDGKIVDRAAFSAVPSSAIRSLAIVKGGRPRIIIVTKANTNN